MENVDYEVSEILKGNTTILSFVQSLREKLTDKDVSNRETAITQLISILTRLSDDFLSSNEVATLLEFFYAKLIDDTALLGVSIIRAIHFLTVTCINFPQNAEHDLFKFVIQDQNVQSFGQQDRYLVLTIFDHLFNTRLDSLRSIGPEFVLGFMRAIETERDPRCLLLAFHLFQRVVSLFPLGPFTSDLFELIACYFPIDFKPPDNDPYGITSEQLSKALRKSLVSHETFANLCYDLAQEKLADEQLSTSGRTEVFELLSAAYERFEPSTLKCNVDDLWDGIRVEALNPQEKSAVLDPSLIGALVGLITSLSKLASETGLNSDLIAFLDKILASMHPCLIKMMFRLIFPDWCLHLSL